MQINQLPKSSLAHLTPLRFEGLSIYRTAHPPCTLNVSVVASTWDDQAKVMHHITLNTFDVGPVPNVDVLTRLDEAALRSFMSVYELAEHAAHRAMAKAQKHIDAAKRKKKK